jgi:TRAP-type C4-dicarboxylate transport system permease small subunit
MSKGFRWVFGHFEEALCAFVFAIMSIITFVNIISRYLLKYSLAFTEEVVVSFFVWLTLLGASIAFREGAHLGFSLITDRLPKEIQKFLIWLSATLGGVLFLILIYFAVLQVEDEIAMEMTSMGMAVPQWWYTIGVPVWSILVVIRIFQGAHRASQNLRRI